MPREGDRQLYISKLPIACSMTFKTQEEQASTLGFERYCGPDSTSWSKLMRPGASVVQVLMDLLQAFYNSEYQSLTRDLG